MQARWISLINFRCLILVGLVFSGANSCSFPTKPAYPSSFPYSPEDLNDLIGTVGRNSGNSVSCSTKPVFDQASFSAVLNEYSNSLEKYIIIQEHIVMNASAAEADQYQYIKPITLTWDLVLEGRCDTPGPLLKEEDSMSELTTRFQCPQCCVVSGDPNKRKRFLLIQSNGPSSLTLHNLIFHRGGFGPEVIMNTDAALASDKDITIGGCALLRSIRTLKVENVRFYDCMGFSGGAVGLYAKEYIDDPSYLVKTAHIWTNVIIRNSQVLGSGGGVLYEIDGHDGLVVFQNLDAEETSAGYSQHLPGSFGYAFHNQSCDSKILYPEGVGGAIAMRSDSLMMMDSEKRLKVTIKDCTFRNSFALLEVPSEDGCHVFGTPTTSSGGAISLSGALQVDITNTSVVQSQSSAVGGAIAISNRFSLAETEPALTIIRNSSFINCSVVTALGGNAYVPGHYYNGMEVPITNGGAIGINGGFTLITNSSFSNCQSAGSGGAISYYDGPCGYEISGYEELGCKKSTIDAPHLFLDNNLHFHNNLASKSPEAISWDTDLSYANSDDVVVLPETKTELCPLSSEDQAGSSSMQVRWKWNVNETQGAVFSNAPCTLSGFIASVQAIFDKNDDVAMPKLDILSPSSTERALEKKERRIGPFQALIYTSVALVSLAVVVSIFAWSRQSRGRVAFGRSFRKASTLSESTECLLTKLPSSSSSSPPSSSLNEMEKGTLISTKAELSENIIHSGRDVILDAIDSLPDGDTTDIQELWDSVIDKIEERVGEITVIPLEELHYKQMLHSDTFKQVMMCDWRGSDVAVGKIRFEMVFDVRSLEDLAQEITLLVRLSHPSLVRMFGVTENAPGIVLEHLKTGTLFAYRRERDPSLFTPALLMRIASQIAKGVRYLHSNRVIHFDIRCQNILVDEDGQGVLHCKISDLSLARLRHESTMIVTGGSRGTVCWMAPELFIASEDDAHVTEKVDLFSFGITLWELWTGKLPYEGLSDFSIMDGVRSGTLRPQIPESCHPTLAALMQECWSTDPSSRPDIATVDGILDSLLKTLS